MKNLTIIEVVRHPLYVIIQQTLNHENWSGGNYVRDFHIKIDDKNKNVPYFTKDNDFDFDSLKSVEKAILEIKFNTEKALNFKEINKDKILTIPFESFVLSPDPYIKKITDKLNTELTKVTRKVLKQQKVPRKKVSDGIPLQIYRRCGWVPPDKNLSEKEELEKRRKFADAKGARKEFLFMLDDLIEQYERNHAWI